MNRALLLDGADAPSGFWVRYAVHQAIARLKVHGIVLAGPVAAFSALFWKVELGEKGTAGSILYSAAATVAGAALLHVVLGALLDFVCETSRFGALLGREVRFYFHTPVPYMVMVLFTLASGYLFTMQLGRSGIVSYQDPFYTIASFLIFLVPILTIRAFAEEKATGTVEPLLTAPVSEAQVVAAKFFGAMAFFAAMLLPTIA